MIGSSNVKNPKKKSITSGSCQDVDYMGMLFSPKPSNMVYLQPTTMSPALRKPLYGTFPGVNIVVSDMMKATASAAAIAAKHIDEFTNGSCERIKLEKPEKNRRVKILDTVSHNAFEASLATASVIYHGQDAEGAKEAAVHKLGEAMPLANGIYGNGKKEALFVVDVIEGTTKAAHGHNNAISVVAVSEKHGIKKIPKIEHGPYTGEDATYVRKLFAPQAYRKVISLHKSAAQNLEAMLATEYVSRPEHITVAIMKRACNERIVRDAKSLGVHVQLIDSGDLLWGLKAMLSAPHHPVVMMGRGGASEGSITMVMAKALSATGQIRVIEENNDIDVTDTTDIWEAESFVPGKHALSVFSAITYNDAFDLPAVLCNQKKNTATVHNLVISSRGVNRVKSTVPFYKS